MLPSTPRSAPLRTATAAPVAAVALGLAAFSGMDAAIKSASLATGVFSALLGRNLVGTGLAASLWLTMGRPKPTWRVLRIHALRAAMTSAMAALFFYGLARVPMAEGMAVSFISPILALYFAALLLKERIRRQAVLASLLGIAGVLVIVSSHVGDGYADAQALRGSAAILLSATFYAVNLVLQRKQAMLAGPIEVALFQNLFVTLIFLCFSPFLWTMPDPATWHTIALGAALATCALMLLAWGYARAETQVLVPLEYSAFLWAALFGYVFFDETVDAATLVGTVLIVLGCWIGTRRGPARKGVFPAPAPDAPPLT